MSHKKAQVFPVFEGHGENRIPWTDCTLLKSWVRILTQKLKNSQKEIEQLKFEKEQEMIKHNARIEELEKEQVKNKNANRSINNKLLQAIVTIKQSLWNRDLNRDDLGSITHSLHLENRNLRNWLKLQQKYDSKVEVEKILKSEEILIRNKENFLRSRSMQVKNIEIFNQSKKGINSKRKVKFSKGKLVIFTT